MTKLFITLFICFIWFTSIAQNKFSISGLVIDSINKKPIEYASVAVYKKADNSLVSGTVTNPKGEFTIKGIQAGKYNLKFSFIGFKNKFATVEIENTSLNISVPFTLNSSSFNLSEVQITDKQNEKQVSIEKTKINVAQNISSVSGNITDVLKSQPSVSIDGDNTIYLRGNKNILILMDGIPTTVSSLNSIPAANVDNIEIVTNPDAK